MKITLVLLTLLLTLVTQAALAGEKDKPCSDQHRDRVNCVK